MLLLFLVPLSILDCIVGLTSLYLSQVSTFLECRGPSTVVKSHYQNSLQPKRKTGLVFRYRLMGQLSQRSRQARPEGV